MEQTMGLGGKVFSFLISFYCCFGVESHLKIINVVCHKIRDAFDIRRLLN